MNIKKYIGKTIRTKKSFRDFYTDENITKIHTYPNGHIDLVDILTSIEFRDNSFVTITGKLGRGCKPDEVVGDFNRYIWVQNKYGGTYAAPSDLIFKKILPKSEKLKWILGYLSLCIPAAMLARVTRKLTGRKGTPLERFLMEYYYKMQKRILG